MRPPRCAFPIVASLAAGLFFLTAGQASAEPSQFDGHTDPNLVVNSTGGTTPFTATFNGGELLYRHFSFIPGDTDGIYGTTSTVSGGYADPLTVSFSQPLTNVNIFGYDTSSTVPQRVDGSVLARQAVKRIPEGAGPLSSLTVTGHDIASASGPDLPGWNFAIVQINSDQGTIHLAATNPVPEPSSLVLLALGGAVAMLALRRRRA